MLELPAGGSVDVPVFGIGQGLYGTDLADFDGFTQTAFFVGDADADSEIYLSYSADDVGLLAGKGTITSFGITFATLTNTCSTTLINYTPTFLVGYDSGSYLSIAVADATGDVTITQTGSSKAAAWTAAGGFTLTGDVSVVGTLSASAINSVVLSYRDRVTAAEINAGHEILAAITGKSYRIVSVKAIAYGGAVGATTTVDVLGTQSAGSVKLVTFAQADLTQSSVLTDSADGTVQADGASYTACDATTAITVGKTGSDVTTATGVDFIIQYVIE